jgi:hypothetical protein
MHFSSRFYQTAAVASVISAVTTLGLIFLPYFYHGTLGMVPTFEDNIRRIHDPAYTGRLWIYFFHPFFVATAALGIAMRKRREAAGLVVPGFLLFCLWAFTEMLQQAISLVANHYTWRMTYKTSSPEMQQMIQSQMFGFEAIWNGMYMLLLVGFIGANLLYSRAMSGPSLLERALRWMFLAAAVLSIFNWISVFPLRPFQMVTSSMDRVLTWVYPLLQPLARTLVGVWLWRNAVEERTADLH